jgi:pilus assembly protein CpaC
MYENRSARHQLALCSTLVLVTAGTLVLLSGASGAAAADWTQDFASPSVVRKISGLSEKLELTTNTSRILTLDKNIPRVQVNNPELLAVTPLSATQVQISAKKAGVTQVNLWDEEGGIHTVDVLIYGDARELQVALQTQFPHTSIKVFRYSESLVLTGFVDRPDQISPIMSLAQDYAPKVINNISVGGVQQVLLKVKVMEISRTKLRDLGTDWAVFNGSSILAASNVSGLLETASTTITAGGNLAKAASSQTGQTVQFGVFNGDTVFLGFLAALQEKRIAKILAEPNIVAVSGRPAQFQVGGEIPIPVPQSLGTTTIEFKQFGTIVDFLPIVLGNGNVRLEVRPQVTERDDANGVLINGTLVPALTTRRVDTAVEMKAGQTFALAGLVQEKSLSRNRGLPYVSEVPVLGIPFRRTVCDVDEVELLIMVTPQFVDPIDACEAPCGGPGYATTFPGNKDLYCAGHVEVPRECNPRYGLYSCGGDECDCNSGFASGGGVMIQGGQPPMINGSTGLPGGTGYDELPTGAAPEPAPANAPPQTQPAPPSAPEKPESTGASSAPIPLPSLHQSSAQTMPEDITLPAVEEDPGLGPQPRVPATPAATGSGELIEGAGQRGDDVPAGPVPSNTMLNPWRAPAGSAVSADAQGGAPVYTAPRPYSPQRQPVFMRNASRPYNPQPSGVQPSPPQRENSLIGPVGYDLQ